MLDNIHYLKLTDRDHGEILIAVPTPQQGDVWGILAPLRGTPWGDQIRQVTGEAMTHARHGWATPLMREIGPEPLAIARRISDALGLCAHHTSCAVFKPHCRPGKKMPACYDAPHLPPEKSVLATELATCWKDGRYVLIVVGDEFSVG